MRIAVNHIIPGSGYSIVNSIIQKIKSYKQVINNVVNNVVVPKGLEPLLFWTKTRRVASYTKAQKLLFVLFLF